MSNFKEYISSILVISMLSTLCEFIIKNTSASSKTIERGFKLVVSIMLIISVFLPLKNIEFIKILEESQVDTNKVNTINSSLEELTEKQFLQTLKQNICDKSGIHADSISIEFDRQTEKNLCISITEECSYAKSYIKAYVYEQTGLIAKINGE